MIKRLIFDIDDTLIPWEKQYVKNLMKILKENDIKIGKIKFYILLKSITKYEYCHTKWDNEELKEYVYQKLKFKISDQELTIIFDWLKDCVLYPASKELIDTLDYLSKKYDLVILSNSLQDVQETRLEKFGIKKYFKEIYCGNDIMKPAEKAYLRACGKRKVTECIIIGDNLLYDVIEPSKLGIKPIYINKKKHKEYLTIDNVVKLKEIL